MDARKLPLAFVRGFVRDAAACADFESAAWVPPECFPLQADRQAGRELPA